MAKDPLCPLGFHPQVRWPTRCKRCFREYKEHVPKKEELDSSSSSGRMNYSSMSAFSRSFDFGEDSTPATSSTRSQFLLTRASSTEESSSTPKDSKDYSTPYSSLSPEALSRLNRIKDERRAPSPSPASSTESLKIDAAAGVIADTRRKTTDLSSLTSSTSSSSSTASRYESREDLRKSPEPSKPSFGKSQSNSSSDVESVTFRLRKSPNPPEETPEKPNSTASSSSSASSTTNKTKPVSTSSTSLPPKAPIKPKTTTSSTLGLPGTPGISLTGSKSPEVKKKLAPAAGSVVSASKSASMTPEETDVKKKVKRKRLLIQGVKEVTPQPSFDEGMDSPQEESADVAFIIQVKQSSHRKRNPDDDDETMSMTTDTTETTLVDLGERNKGTDDVTGGGGVSHWEFEEARRELERLREKCAKMEREKAELLLRRVDKLPPVDSTPRAQSNELIKLQAKVDSLTATNEDLKNEKKGLDAKVQELSNELAARPNQDYHQRQIAEMRSKLSSAETMLEQLTEEKREALQQMQDMQSEFEEMQDSFREEQSEEFATLKKELDDATKNIRLLQFKLRKTEKRSDQLEAEKKELEGRMENSNIGKIQKLEEELAKLKGENERLVKTCTLKAGVAAGGTSPRIKKKSPVLTKAPSGEKIDPAIPQLDVDPSQLLTDLQSTLERESDMREQLKFAEEEVNSLRQKISRIEEENESLLIQIKKMSTKPSLSNIKGPGKELGGKATIPQPQKEEKLEVNDLKLQLELNEQESKIMQRKVEELEKANNKLTKELQGAEEKLHKVENSPSLTKSKSIDETSVLRRKIIEKEREVERLESELAATKNKGKLTRGKSLEEETKKLEEFKLDLKKAQTELSKVRAEAEEQRKSFDEDLSKARKDVENHQTKIVQTLDSNKRLQSEIEKLRKELGGMKGHYEGIQEDFVIKNSNLTSQKESLEKAHSKLKKEFETIDKELKTLRETYNSKQDAWIVEKLNMQEKMREMEEKAKKLMSLPGDSETNKLKVLLKQQTKEFEARFQELEVYREQFHQLRKENEDLKSKLEDYEKVVQVQMRNLQVETPKQDKEIALLKEKILAEEKHHKNEIAQLKMKHDKEVALKGEDISTIQSQLSRAKRERDTYRQMVDSAQRAISELKSRDRNSSPGRHQVSGLEEVATGARASVLALQERVSSLEDELTEARRESSRSKTELATEKSSFEMRIGEMQQKINELEEDRLISSGRARGAGQRTRLELAWQKEREEQQRRLKEATTLARDLKTTLQELERERDREKLETKRRLDQLKLTLEEDQEDLKRKVGDTQNDLLELRDAHAKLRVLNEKLRRDRERLEKEREVQLKREMGARKVFLEREKLLDQLLGLLTRVHSVHSSNTSIPTSVSASAKNVTIGEVLHYLQNIKEIKEVEDVTNPREKRRSAFRKAASVGEGEDPESIRNSQESLSSMPGGSSAYGKEHYGIAGKRTVRGYSGSSSALNLQRGGRLGASSVSNGSDVSSSMGSLYRKSLSLEQTAGMLDEQKIWKGESVGSASSLHSASSMDGQYSRGSSMERMSTISSKSEKPKGTSLMGKMKKLVKSRSIEEPTPIATSLVKAGVQASGVASSAGSDLSLNSDTERSERGETPSRRMKDRVKGIFKKRDRSQSRDRSPSTERLKMTPSSNIAAPVPKPTGRETTPGRDTSVQRPLTQSRQRPLMR